jgi:predicted CoA-binding protein
MNQDSNILNDDGRIAELLAETKTIAVLGIKPETHSMQPAFYVPKYMQDRGFKIFPVPVYYPEVAQILGEPVVRKVSEIESQVDMVNVFRKPADIPQHIEDIISAGPISVWFQLGIVNNEAAAAFAAAGIKVVQNRCLLVEHRSLAR